MTVPALTTRIENVLDPDDTQQNIVALATLLAHQIIRATRDKPAAAGALLGAAKIVNTIIHKDFDRIKAGDQPDDPGHRIS